MTKLFKDLTAIEFMQLLIKLNTNNKTIKWAKDKTGIEFIEQCYRGDWLVLLFKRLQPKNIRMLILTQGHIANTVRHLMIDKRSIAAVDAAIAFGNDKINKTKLDAISKLDAIATDAFNAVKCSFVEHHSYAAYAAAAAIFGSDAAGAAAAASEVAADASGANYKYAKQKNRLLTANICRQYLIFSKIKITL